MAKFTNKEETEYIDGVLDVDAEMVDGIEELVDSGQQAMVLNVIADLHCADLAMLISHLRFDYARRLFEWLPIEQAGDGAF